MVCPRYRAAQMGRKVVINYKSRVIKRGEIWTVDLRFSRGEISKIRPALIVSANAINEISPIIVVIPLTSQVPHILGPERIIIEKVDAGLTKNSVALTTQIRAIEKGKFDKRVGVLKREKMKEIEESIKVVLSLLEANNDGA